MASNSGSNDNCNEVSGNVIPDDFVETGDSSISSSRRGRIEATHLDTWKFARYERRQIRSCADYICPSCQLTIRPDDLLSHLDLETNKLKKIFSSKLLKRKTNSSKSKNCVSRPQPGTSSQHLNGTFSSEESSLSPSCSNVNVPSKHLRCSENSDADYARRLSTSTEDAFESPTNASGDIQCKETYKRIKINRLLRIQSKRWQYKDIQDDATCPVCAETVFASGPEELQLHVDECLKKQDDASSDEEQTDLEGDEYEWCGFRKVRLTSLLRSQGQLEALGTRMQKGNEDENVEVCLFEEEENQYGPPQYSQADLSPNKNEITSNAMEFSDVSDNRGLALPSDAMPPVQLATSSANNIEVDARNINASIKRSDLNCNSEAVVNALRAKLHDLEGKGDFICHICHGLYNTPLTSITCWHVHCEQCWLQALSNQKLCPQCKTIVSPTDLRRVYL